MSLNLLEAVSGQSVLNAVSCADTAAATSGWIDVRFKEGIILLTLDVGIITGTVTFTFEDATDGSGTANAVMTPIGGAIPVVTTSLDVATYYAAFPASQPRGWIAVIGTIVTGPAVLSYSVLHLDKY